MSIPCVVINNNIYLGENIIDDTDTVAHRYHHKKSFIINEKDDSEAAAAAANTQNQQQQQSNKLNQDTIMIKIRFNDDQVKEGEEVRDSNSAAAAAGMTNDNVISSSSTSSSSNNNNNNNHCYQFLRYLFCSNDIIVTKARVYDQRFKTYYYHESASLKHIKNVSRDFVYSNRAAAATTVSKKIPFFNEPCSQQQTHSNYISSILDDQEKIIDLIFLYICNFCKFSENGTSSEPIDDDHDDVRCEDEFKNSCCSTSCNYMDQKDEHTFCWDNKELIYFMNNPKRCTDLPCINIYIHTKNLFGTNIQDNKFSKKEFFLNGTNINDFVIKIRSYLNCLIEEEDKRTLCHSNGNTTHDIMQNYISYSDNTIESLIEAADNISAAAAASSSFKRTFLDHYKNCTFTDSSAVITDGNANPNLFMINRSYKKRNLLKSLMSILLYFTRESNSASITKKNNKIFIWHPNKPYYMKCLKNVISLTEYDIRKKMIKFETIDVDDFKNDTSIYNNNDPTSINELIKNVTRLPDAVEQTESSNEVLATSTTHVQQDENIYHYDNMCKNKYPIYIVSVSRYDHRWTSRFLDFCNVPYYLVVEPSEYESYFQSLKEGYTIFDDLLVEEDGYNQPSAELIKNTIIQAFRYKKTKNAALSSSKKSSKKDCCGTAAAAAVDSGGFALARFIKKRKRTDDEIRNMLLVLPRDYSKTSSGSMYARNYAWDHSINVVKSKYHWCLDDNIMFYNRNTLNQKMQMNSSMVFRFIEDFVDMYENVGIAGHNYSSFVVDISNTKPLIFNTRVYSSILIRNDLPFRWRLLYNEDTDLCLNVLKKTNMCTVLFNCITANKMSTMKAAGGNTSSLYKLKDAHLHKSKNLADHHPDITKVVYKYNRIHHAVDYSSFKQKTLILKKTLNEQHTTIDPASLLYSYEKMHKFVYINVENCTIHNNVDDAFNYALNYMAVAVPSNDHLKSSNYSLADYGDNEGNIKKRFRSTKELSSNMGEDSYYTCGNEECFVHCASASHHHNDKKECVLHKKEEYRINDECHNKKCCWSNEKIFICKDCICSSTTMALTDKNFGRLISINFIKLSSHTNSCIRRLLYDYDVLNNISDVRYITKTLSPYDLPIPPPVEYNNDVVNNDDDNFFFMNDTAEAEAANAVSSAKTNDTTSSEKKNSTCGYKKGSCKNFTMITYSNKTMGKCKDHGGYLQVLNALLSKLKYSKNNDKCIRHDYYSEVYGNGSNNTYHKINNVTGIVDKYKNQRGKCYFCLKKVQFQMVIDPPESHILRNNNLDRICIIPLSKSLYGDDVNNVVITCELCRGLLAFYDLLHIYKDDNNVYHSRVIYNNIWDIIFSSNLCENIMINQHYPKQQSMNTDNSSSSSCSMPTMSKFFLNGHHLTNDLPRYLVRICDSLKLKQQKIIDNIKSSYSLKQISNNVRSNEKENVIISTTTDIYIYKWTSNMILSMIQLQSGRCAITGVYFCFCENSECPFKPTVDLIHPEFKKHNIKAMTYHPKYCFIICQCISNSRTSDNVGYTHFIDTLLLRKKEYKQQQYNSIGGGGGSSSSNNVFTTTTNVHEQFIAPPQKNETFLFCKCLECTDFSIKKNKWRSLIDSCGYTSKCIYSNKGLLEKNVYDVGSLCDSTSASAAVLLTSAADFLINDLTKSDNFYFYKSRCLLLQNGSIFDRWYEVNDLSFKDIFKKHYKYCNQITNNVVGNDNYIYDNLVTIEPVFGNTLIQESTKAVSFLSDYDNNVRYLDSVVGNVVDQIGEDEVLSGRKKNVSRKRNAQNDAQSSLNVASTTCSNKRLKKN